MGTVYTDSWKNYPVSTHHHNSQCFFKRQKYLLSMWFEKGLNRWLKASVKSIISLFFSFYLKYFTEAPTCWRCLNLLDRFFELSLVHIWRAWFSPGSGIVVAVKRRNIETIFQRISICATLFLWSTKGSTHSTVDASHWNLCYVIRVHYFFACEAYLRCEWKKHRAWLCVLCSSCTIH